MQKHEQKLFTSRFLFITILNFLIMTGDGMIYFLYPLHLKSMGKNPSQIGLIIGIQALAAVLARIFIGPKIDKLGRVFFIRWGLGLILLCTFLYSLPIESDSYLVLVRLIHGAGWAVYFTAIFTWTADFAPKGRMAEAIGIFGISGLLTLASGPQFGEYILKLSGGDFNYIFATAAFILSFGAFMSLWIKDVKIPGKRENQGNIIKLLTNPGVMVVCLAALFFGSGISAVFTFIAPFTREIHIGTVAPFFTAYALGSIGIRLLSGRAADKFGRMAMIIPALAIASICQSYIHVINNINLLFGLGIGLGVSHGMIYPAMNALMMDRVGEENRGAGTGLFNAVTDIGFFLGGVIFGFIAHKYGFGIMYSVSSMTIITGLLLFVGFEYIFSSMKGKRSVRDSI